MESAHHFATHQRSAHSLRAHGDAGRHALEFNTVSISDGIHHGHGGMRTSLVSREVIADSIELVTREIFRRSDRFGRV